MILNNLLEEVKLGTKFYNESKSSDEIINLVDPDLHLLMISKRISKLKEGLTEDTETLNIVNALEKDFKYIEDKAISGTGLTTMGSKVKLYSLVENYNKLVDKFNNKKYYGTVNKDKIARIFSSTVYGMNKLAEESSTTYTVRNVPYLVEDITKADLSLIEDIIN